MTHIWSRYQRARREELAFNSGLPGKREFPGAQGGWRPVSKTPVSSKGTQQPSGEEQVDDHWAPHGRRGHLAWATATSPQFQGPRC